MAKTKENTPQSTEIVERRDDVPHFVIPTQSTPIALCPTSLDVTTEDGKCRLIAATGVSDYNLEVGKVVEIAVTDWICYPSSRVDETTGEVSEYIRTVLISDKGETIASSSPVIANRLQAIVQLWGRGPWRPPIVCLLTKRQSRNPERAFHDLRVKPRE